MDRLYEQFINATDKIHRVFVSYKYSDAHETRDKIMKVLVSQGHYYNGEKGYSKLEVADTTLKTYLADMIFNTSVTVVVISPQVIYSDWVNWEIRYSLRKVNRGERTSQRNGIVCVIQKLTDYYGLTNYDWAYNYTSSDYVLRKEILPTAIVDNMDDTFGESQLYNRYLKQFLNLDSLDYCVVVNEDDFLSNPTKYIHEAYLRSKNDKLQVKVNE